MTNHNNMKIRLDKKFMKIKIYDQKPQPGNLYCLNFLQYVLV